MEYEARTIAIFNNRNVTNKWHRPSRKTLTLDWRVSIDLFINHKVSKYKGDNVRTDNGTKWSKLKKSNEVIKKNRQTTGTWLSDPKVLHYTLFISIYICVTFLYYYLHMIFHFRKIKHYRPTHDLGFVPHSVMKDWNSDSIAILALNGATAVTHVSFRTGWISPSINTHLLFGKFFDGSFHPYYILIHFICFLSRLPFYRNTWEQRFQVWGIRSSIRLCRTRAGICRGI